jgi:hypothetical protein
MMKRTLSKPLPSPGKNSSWPQDPSTEKGAIARGEATLATMPFVRPKFDDQESPTKFEWTAVGRDGKSHEFYQTFTPGRNLNLPGPTADRVMRALLSMSPAEIGQDLETRTSLKTLIGICGLRKSGRTYDQIRRAIARLQGVTIESNAFWDYRDQKYIGTTAEIFSECHLSTTGSKEMVRVQWAPSFVDLMSTWSKPVNLHHFSELETCLDRKLYQISAFGIYQQGEMIEDLKLLCHGQLGIDQNREHVSELKRSLSGPMEALRGENLLDITIEKDEESPSIKSDWLVRARPMERMLEVCEEIDDPQYWAFQLAGRGMMVSQDDSLDRCRKWIDRKGVNRARSAVKKWDRRGGKGKPPARRANVLDAGQTDQKNISSQGGTLFSSKESGAPSEEATDTDCRSSTSEPSEGRERAVEEKIAVYLQLIDRDVHGSLHRRASRYIDGKYPGLGGARRRALVNEAVGTIFLEKEGPESLPDPLSDQLE